MKTLKSFFAFLMLLIIASGSIAQSNHDIPLQILSQVHPWRLQIRIHTCDEKNAGTDSKVFFMYNYDHRDRYYLAYGRNDRRRNHDEFYDLVIPELLDLNNIQRLALGIEGSDAWCFDRVELYLNNPFKDDAAAGQLGNYLIYRNTQRFEISTRGGLSPLVELENLYSFVEKMRVPVISNQVALKASGIPELIAQNGKLIILREVMESMVESYVGNQMINGSNNALRNAKWGKKEGRAYVGIRHNPEKHAPNEARLDLDITRDGTPPAGSLIRDFRRILSVTNRNDMLSFGIEGFPDVFSIYSGPALPEFNSQHNLVLQNRPQP
ncbi:MAG: hypothetical protein H6581_00245 [Bacteroidia bacterium]|nr:hypothetical protein [Bacteroidia bacterium]